MCRAAGVDTDTGLQSVETFGGFYEGYKIHDLSFSTPDKGGISFGMKHHSIFEL